MSSGIAHDISNAISPIVLYTEAMLEREALSDRARGYLSTIQRAVDDVTADRQPHARILPAARAGGAVRGCRRSIRWCSRLWS